MSCSVGYTPCSYSRVFSGMCNWDLNIFKARDSATSSGTCLNKKKHNHLTTIALLPWRGKVLVEVFHVLVWICSCLLLACTLKKTPFLSLRTAIAEQSSTRTHSCPFLVWMFQPVSHPSGPWMCVIMDASVSYTGKAKAQHSALAVVSQVPSGGAESQPLTSWLCSY